MSFTRHPVLFYVCVQLCANFSSGASPKLCIIFCQVSGNSPSLVLFCIIFFIIPAIIPDIILGIALSDTFFFSALKEVSPQTITLLFTFGQVVTVILAVLLLGESLPGQGWAGIALIITGITIGMFPSFAEKGRSTLRGIVFGLISILLMSFAVILTKKGLAQVSTLYATFIRMLAGTMGMLLVGVATRRLGGWVSPFRDTRLIWKFTLSVCVITIGGFWLAIVAFKYTSVAVANSLIATEPVFVLPVAALLLKERVTGQAATGAVIATLGVIALCTSGVAA